MNQPAPTAPAESAGFFAKQPCEALAKQGSGSLLPDTFLEAWLNTQHTVCRQPLPAYSLHSHMMLCAVQSPLAHEHLPEGFKLTWEHLWEALAAVTTPYGQPLRYPTALRCIVRQRWHRLNLEAEVRAFRAWQNDYLSAPEVFSSEGGGRELTAPGILARVVFLQRHLHGYTARELWTLPIGQALWLHAATLEQLSESVSLLGEEEGKLMALMKSIQDGTTPIPTAPDPASGDSALSRVAALAGISRL